VNAGSERVFGAEKDLKGSHKFSGISIDHSAPATSLADDLVLLPWWFSLVIPPTLRGSGARLAIDKLPIPF